MKKVGLRLLIVFIVIAVALFGALYAVRAYIQSKYDKMNYKPIDETDLGITQQEKPKSNVEKVTRFIIFGSDSRDTDNQYAGRSDTMMIVVIDNENKGINLISIPRDSYVNVPGYGMTKLNHAYAYGQEQLSIKTINTTFDLDITQYMTIDFSGLVDTIDKLGGVEVDLTQEEVDFINGGMDAANKIAGPGRVNLNGKQALKHSRNRYIGLDFARTQRQRTIIISLLQKVSKQQPSEIIKLADEILPNITTNMDMDKYEDMFLEIADSRTEYLKNINSVQVPAVDYGWDSWIDGIYYFSFDLERAKSDFNKYYYLAK